MGDTDNDHESTMYRDTKYRKKTNPGFMYKGVSPLLPRLSVPSLPSLFLPPFFLVPFSLNLASGSGGELYVGRQMFLVNFDKPVYF